MNRTNMTAQTTRAGNCS